LTSSVKWWPRTPRKEPDPFTEKERDAILQFYRAKLPSKQYALVCFRFYTGTRPSEAVALKWGRVDLAFGKAIINSSRTFGEDNAPKTEASSRTITLLPNVVDVLRALQPLHVGAEDYVFTDEQGKAVDQNEFGRKFTAVLRVLNIRPRRFYNTRHKHISADTYVRTETRCFVRTSERRNQSKTRRKPKPLAKPFERKW
jgi:integrase